MSRVEQFERIRREHRDEGASIRELARRHRVHRRTVRQALECAVPPARKPSERQAPALGAHEATVRGWLEADQAAPRKQRDRGALAALEQRRGRPPTDPWE